MSFNTLECLRSYNVALLSRKDTKCILCLPIDSHLQWTTPIAMLPVVSLSDSKYVALLSHAKTTKHFMPSNRLSFTVDDSHSNVASGFSL